MRFSQELYDKHMLDNGLIQGRERRYYDFPIVDADAHHLEVIRNLAPYFDPKYRDMVAQTEKYLLVPRDLGDRYVAGRLRRANYPSAQGEQLPDEVHWFKQVLREMGIDYAIVFPTDLLSLGLHPDIEYEVAAAEAYARWMKERVLPHEKSIKTMLYLPYNDAEASLRLIEEYGDVDGVAGFMVTSVRHARVHSPEYLRIYDALQERNVPIGFHTLDHWRERPFELFDSFLAVHTIGFPFYNMMHMTNFVMNGIPEMFPKLKTIFFEAGVAFLPFIMYRLDTMYELRPSDAPLLKRKPSEYIREFFYTTQPMEWPDSMDELQAIFKMIDGTTQLLYASDYPHWDFDMPCRIYDVPFLTEEEKRQILGGNAMKLFGFEQPEVMRGG